MNAASLSSEFGAPFIHSLSNSTAPFIYSVVYFSWYVNVMRTGFSFNCSIKHCMISWFLSNIQTRAHQLPANLYAIKSIVKQCNTFGRCSFHRFIFLVTKIKYFSASRLWIASMSRINCCHWEDNRRVCLGIDVIWWLKGGIVLHYVNGNFSNNTHFEHDCGHRIGDLPHLHLNEMKLIVYLSHKHLNWSEVKAKRSFLFALGIRLYFSRALLVFFSRSVCFLLKCTQMLNNCAHIERFR